MVKKKKQPPKLTITDTPPVSVTNQAKRKSLRTFVEENKAIITLLSLLIDIVIPFTVYFLTVNQKNTDSTEPPTEIETLKENIEERVHTIKEEFHPENISKAIDVKIHPDVVEICDFQLSVLKLITYQGAHYISSFDSKSLKESFTLAKSNLLQRKSYDGAILEVISKVDKIYEYGVNNGIDNYMPFKQKKDLIEASASQWVDQDTIQNNIIYTRIEEIENNPNCSSAEFEKVLVPLEVHKKDPENYRFQKNLYAYLLEIKNLYDLTLKQYEIGM